MYERRRARIVLAVLVLAALVLISVDVRTGEDGPLDRARGLATSVLRPVQDGVGTLVSPIGDLAGSVRGLFTARSENQRLLDRVERLETRERSMVDLRRENDELRALLDIADRTGLETVGARVVALAPSSFEWTITIDVGASDGVERGMPVIDGDGLVGRVIQVTPSASRVLLAIDPTFAAAARSAGTGEIGTIDGRGGDPMRFRPLDREGELRVGDELVTSSYQGGAFPGGIPIGTVLDVVDTGSRDAREFQVSPYVDFTRLHHVLVVLERSTEQVPPFEDSAGLPFQRPPVDATQEDGDRPADGDDEVGEGEGDASGDEAP